MMKTKPAPDVLHSNQKVSHLACRAGRLVANAVVLALGTMSLAAATQEVPVARSGPVPQAPPTAPPIEFRSVPETSGSDDRPLGLNLWSIGQPTDEEQLYLEYLNRMRANPTAEGQRLATTTDPDVLAAYSYFGVNLPLMQYEFSTNPAAPPLAMNAKLLAAARWHSGDMYTNQYQGHYQTNGSVIMDPGNRIGTNGYSWSTYGENVYSYANSAWHGHAGFAVDWGPGTGGMQDPAGHRQNMLSPNFREVGMGVVDGVNGSVGPQLVTQDLATLSSARNSPLLTGVVYYDFNGNGFYDPGEGIGGVAVNTPGSSYYSVTANSGGFAIPVTSNGSYTVSFTASGLSTQRVVTVAGLNNFKLDLLPVYSPPILSGPNPAGVSISNTYSFTSVAAASGYDWLQTQLAPYAAVEGAENGLANVTVQSTPSYSVLATDLKASGNYSFQLAHNNPPEDQILTLNPSLLLATNSQLTFAKYLGFSFLNEVARAQISTNGGSGWFDLWNQAGNDGSTSVDTAFHRITNSLAAYAGLVAQFRFVYSFSAGSYYLPGTGVGLYLDDIGISSASQAVVQTINTVPAGNSFAFYPTNAGNYLLQVRAHIGSRALPWGPADAITATVPPPVISLAGRPAVAGSQVQIDFSVSNYRAGMTFQLWKASDPAGAWAQDSSATLQTLVANSQFRFTTSTGGATKTFYRVKGSYRGSAFPIGILKLEKAGVEFRLQAFWEPHRLKAELHTSSPNRL